AIYMISGIVLGTLGGWFLKKFKLEKYLADFIQNKRNNQTIETQQVHIPFSQRSKEVIKEAWNITIKIVPYVLLGVGVGAAIHGFIPTGFFENYITKSNPFAVPIAVIVGIPMYANATSVIPIVQALIAKGIPLGTGLAFMMATVGLSLPEFLILKKIMKTKLLIIFFGIVGICMMILGYFFNAIL
ncbi:MAG TPA: permease, partial [Candidatus Absconditabacterales bacterium]|nr:permease [Candidatus Absconditabacterales bacterium]